MLVWKKTNVIPEQLNLEMPELFCELWSWFLELHETRTSNRFGPNAISYSEIKAWSELTGRSILPHQVTLIKKLDRVVLNG